MAKRRKTKRAAPKKRKTTRRRRASPKRRSNPGIPVLAVNPRRRRRSHARRANPGRKYRFTRRRNPSMGGMRTLLVQGALLLAGGALAVGVSRFVESKVTQPPQVMGGIELATGIALLAIAGAAKFHGKAATVAAGAAAGMGFAGGGKLYDSLALPAPAAAPTAGTGSATATPDPSAAGGFGRLGAFGSVSYADDLDGLEGSFGAVDYATQTDDDGDPLFNDDMDPFGGVAPYS